jgi:hypothetical protein
VTDSAGSVTGALAENPRTLPIADAARAAMAAGIEVSSYLCAGMLILALATTAFVKPARHE